MIAVSKLKRFAQVAALAVGVSILTFGGGAMAANLPENAPVPVVAQSAAPAGAALSAPEASSYAVREQAELLGALEKFQGGDELLIIGPSAVAVVIIVLLIVLLA